MSKDSLSNLFDKRGKKFNEDHYRFTKYNITKRQDINKQFTINNDLVIVINEFIINNRKQLKVNTVSGIKRKLSVLDFMAIKNLNLTYPNIFDDKYVKSLIHFNYSHYLCKSGVMSEIEATKFLTSIIKDLSQESILTKKQLIKIIRKANNKKDDTR